jgi:hypothetical protein
MRTRTLLKMVDKREVNDGTARRIGLRRKLLGDNDANTGCELCPEAGVRYQIKPIELASQRPRSVPTTAPTTPRVRSA